MARARLAAISFFVCLATFGWSAIVTKSIDYTQGGTKLRGYLAYDDSKKGYRPMVLVFHDWDGMNEYEQMRCRMLAEAGYVAFAPDVYGVGAKVDTVEEKSAMTMKFYNDTKLFRNRVEAGLEAAIKTPKTNVDPNRVVAIGYCFGGASALELARSGRSLKGVVTFHGSLATKMPMEKNRFHGKILVLTGADDPFVPAAQVQGFEGEMKAANVSVRVVKYPGAVHAFTIKGSESMGLKGVAYNEKADKESWKELLAFLKGL